MRLGIIPQGVRDWFILRSRRFPLPLFDAMGGMLLSRAVMAGVHFGVFDRLAAEAKTAEAVAKEASATPHGMKLLLDALSPAATSRKRADATATLLWERLGCGPLPRARSSTSCATTTTSGVG